MSRLIEAQPAALNPALPVTLQVGDVLRLAASGGRVREGSSVELLGIFTEGLVGTDGTVLTPLGAPNTVLFRARVPGQSTVDVVTGDPWRSTRSNSVTVVVT
ncbi:MULTISPECIES: hypothetical protein [unclassified Pseudofrankia]|uniref:hypothetical protein n=1 Tax=unclassified Pseudofrankia TaxID=2994372 RepID=UPI0008DA0BE4|nr:MULTISPECIES: hypothetical protein [unclassified Pseudofrankia]MDT3444298.1 hypothetical protein [Pseudofrankia sp. BMG5.37]OHV43365.1 hypothetical protein BCD48_28725 [Pseudofrankia sp. BMG5.36]